MYSEVSQNWVVGARVDDVQRERAEEDQSGHQVGRSLGRRGRVVMSLVG